MQVQLLSILENKNFINHLHYYVHNNEKIYQHSLNSHIYLREKTYRCTSSYIIATSHKSIINKKRKVSKSFCLSAIVSLAKNISLKIKDVLRLQLSTVN